MCSRRGRHSRGLARARPLTHTLTHNTRYHCKIRRVAAAVAATRRRRHTERLPPPASAASTSSNTTSYLIPHKNSKLAGEFMSGAY